MCEFCSLGSSSVDRDSQDNQFAGFFSPQAIEIAVSQANLLLRRQQQQDPNEDFHSDSESDGT
jgi:hypothetical protein